MTKMHKIEDAARLAMAGVPEFDDPTTPAKAPSRSKTPLLVAAVVLLAAIAISLAAI